MNECNLFSSVDDMIKKIFKQSFDAFLAESGDVAESYQFAKLSVSIVTKSFSILKENQHKGE